MSNDAAAARTVAALAKGALLRLAQLQQEPTPENYARAYADEAGGAAVRARPHTAPAPWPALVERLARNLERGGRQWTAARRKESLFRVLDGSRSDETRLAQRLGALLQAWEGDRPLDGAEAGDPATPAAAAAAGEVGADASPPTRAADAGRAAPSGVASPAAAGAALVQALGETICAGLGDADVRAVGLARRMSQLGDERVRSASASGNGAPASLPPLPAEYAAACQDAKRWFGQRHELVRQLTALCGELSQGLVELSEEESWSRGQCEALRALLGNDVDVRALREASAMLADTRARQAGAKRGREVARSALKQLLAGMIDEVGALQQHTGGFESAIERHAEAVQAADSLEGLASVVQSMLDDSRQLRSTLGASHERLARDSRRAAELESRVRDLEAELGRLSDEACTDALTQVANRRGLERSFGETSARATADGVPLAVGLIDIDNFKKLNDRLGHGAGDTALKALAAQVRQGLRPGDDVARYGGEEFVVLLHGLAIVEAQQALTRLQRKLSASLFLHEGEEVFVTFSAGVTEWRPGEAMEAAIERADVGLYEAKRTGKNRTCVA